MILLDPKHHRRPYPDERSRELMLKTIDFFESKGKLALKADDRDRTWYADFLDFAKRERLFATLLTPADYGAEDCRWDTWRNCEFAEILGFYGLAYWYTWQVSVLGLGPIWMSDNEAQKKRAAALLEAGEIFAFGLSERAHGADLYSSSMSLKALGSGDYEADGSKYYIGNGNKARMVSTFGKHSESGDYVFFVADSQHPNYRLIKNVVNSQSYVSEFELERYPVAESDILSSGDDAWNSSLNTVNVGKFNLGWASIGMCTHALYEALDHASERTLYGMKVTDFPHVKELFTDSYARLVAMKLVALRAADYMRSASAEDRRYLLYNPVVKMKVTTQGERVIDSLWDVIAAKGFERDTYFEMAARDIRALPKLEGTVHVNVALILKFMANYLFNPAELPEVPRRDDPADDDFLWHQGPTRGLGKVRFHPYREAFASFDSVPNVATFAEQAGVLEALIAEAPPSESQQRDPAFLLVLGELFTNVVYAQLVLENARIYEISDDLVDQIFDFLVRDLSECALALHTSSGASDSQAELALGLVRRPVSDSGRFQRMTAQTYDLAGAYRMCEQAGEWEPRADAAVVVG